MRISAAYGPGKFGLSFELFPPKNDAGEEELFRNLEQLMTFRPDFVTCTYGAGGSTRDKTLHVVRQVRRRYGCSTAAHLTCVGATTDQLRDYLREATAQGVENIVALRGDPPKGEGVFKPAAGGLAYANELVALIRREFPHFGIAVAGYPETHREAPGPEQDLINLKRKVDAGANVVVTQLFYDNIDFFRFQDRCAAVGIRVPIVPGVLPATGLAQIRRISSMCGAKLPGGLVSALEAQGDDPAGQLEVGVEHAVGQVEGLIQHGVPGLHFYVLNRSEATGRILRAVSLSR